MTANDTQDPGDSEQPTNPTQKTRLSERLDVSDEVLEDGKVEMDHLDTVGRLGGPYYTSVNRMEMTREF